MKFHRFTRLKFLSNWGSYSPQEQKLLDKEAEVRKLVNNLPETVRFSPAVSVHMNEYHTIQTDLSVKQENYGELLQRLIRLENSFRKHDSTHKQMLDKAIELSVILEALPAFVKNSQLMNVHTLALKQIRDDISANNESHAALLQRLNHLQSAIHNTRVDILNLGEQHIPASDLVFPNIQARSLIEEINVFLLHEESRIALGYVNPHRVGFRIKFQQDPEKFRAIMQDRRPVLYTLDIHGILTIGDVETKHAVVAAGEDCKAAGIAQLDTDKRNEIYILLEDYKQDLEIAQNELSKLEEGTPQYEGLKENLANKALTIEQYTQSLGGWTPPAGHITRVSINFDSGHYAPHSTWKEAMAAWRAAGFEPFWSPDSRRV